MTEDQIPVAVWSGTFHLFGVDIRCCVLDDGRRLIVGDDIAKLFDAMGSYAAANTKAEAEAMAKFFRWQRGG